MIDISNGQALFYPTWLWKAEVSSLSIEYRRSRVACFGGAWPVLLHRMRTHPHFQKLQATWSKCLCKTPTNEPTIHPSIQRLQIQPATKPTSISRSASYSSTRWLWIASTVLSCVSELRLMMNADHRQDAISEMLH